MNKICRKKNDSANIFKKKKLLTRIHFIHIFAL